MSKVETLRQIPKVDLIIESLPNHVLEQMDIEHVKFYIDEELSSVRERIMKGIQSDVDLKSILSKISARINLN